MQMPEPRHMRSVETDAATYTTQADISLTWLETYVKVAGELVLKLPLAAKVA